MAIDQVLISKPPSETRIALLSGGRLDGFSVVRAGRESVVGNIYLGRVEGALPGLDAAFVNIGLERAGFHDVRVDAQARAFRFRAVA